MLETNSFPRVSISIFGISSSILWPCGKGGADGRGRIQNLFKDLRWSVLQKSKPLQAVDYYCTTRNLRYLIDRVLNAALMVSIFYLHRKLCGSTATGYQLLNTPLD